MNIKQVFGYTPQVKVLEFLIKERVFDFSISDLATYCQISRNSVYTVIKDLQNWQIVKYTRMVGKSKMYQINYNGKSREIVLGVAQLMATAEMIK